MVFGITWQHLRDTAGIVVPIVVGTVVSCKVDPDNRGTATGAVAAGAGFAVSTMSAFKTFGRLDREQASRIGRAYDDANTAGAVVDLQTRVDVLEAQIDKNRFM